MCCRTGGVLFTSGMDPEVADRVLRVAQFERAGVDLAATHDAAPSLGELHTALPDFYHRLVLGEVTSAELAVMARQLDHAAGACARSWAATDPRDCTAGAGVSGVEQCTKISPGLHLTCVQSLAEGWITAADLCPGCTRRFMAALDAAAGEGEPLTWHHGYVQRSSQATGGAA